MTGNSSVENSEPSETSTSEWPAVRELTRFTPPHGATLGRVSLIGMRPQPLIAVTDVETSSRWYQRLLGCRSNHGGSEYEQLVSNDQLVLQLHRFEVEHHHGPIGDRNDKPYGNGVVLWLLTRRMDNLRRELFRAPRHSHKYHRRTESGFPRSQPRYRTRSKLGYA